MAANNYSFTQPRVTKALELCKVLKAAGATFEQVERASAETRGLAAQLARVGPPSDDTWDVVVTFYGTDPEV